MKKREVVTFQTLYLKRGNGREGFAEETLYVHITQSTKIYSIHLSLVTYDGVYEGFESSYNWFIPAQEETIEKGVFAFWVKRCIEILKQAVFPMFQGLDFGELVKTENAYIEERMDNLLAFTEEEFAPDKWVVHK